MGIITITASHGHDWVGGVSFLIYSALTLLVELRNTTEST